MTRRSPSWARSGFSSACLCEGRAELDEILDDPIAAIQKREVSLVLEQPALRAVHVGRQPAAVLERNHAVLSAVPDRDGDTQALRLEAPGPSECQVVVAPAGDAG